MSLIDFNKLTKEEKIKLQKSYKKLLTWRNELEKSGDEDAYSIIDCNSQISKLEELFGKENLQFEPKIKTWEDIEKAYPRYRREASTLTMIPGAKTMELINKITATYKIAKLIELGYGGMITDEEWRDETISKYCIGLNMNGELSGECKKGNSHEFIAFHTLQQAEGFMFYQENRTLVEQYYMI